MSAAPAARPLRRDAARNRARVIEAAAQVIAESGAAFSFDEVARRAGVGRATIYRSFATKEDLVAAVAVARLRGFERLARDAASDPDPGQAFRRVVVHVAERTARDRSTLAALEVAGDIPALAEARAGAAAAIGALVERAKQAGALRPDATFEDLRVLLAGLTHVLGPERGADPAVWRRYAELIVDALSAPGRGAAAPQP